MTLPAGMPTTMIYGTYIYTEADSTDAGDEPQGTPLEGLLISFTPEPDSRIYTHTATGQGVALAEMLATTDAQGRIITPATGAVGFKIPASDQPALTGAPVIPWTAEVVDPMGRIETDRRSFLAPASGNVTLPTAPRYWPDPQAGSPAQWEQLRADAVAAANGLQANVVAAKATIDAYVDDAVQARMAELSKGFVRGDVELILGDAMPDDSNVSPEGLPRVWLKSTGLAPIAVTATAPTFVDVSGAADDLVRIPATRGVDYYLNGTFHEAGDYAASGTMTVTAQARALYVLTGTTSWTRTFNPAVTVWETLAADTFTAVDGTTVTGRVTPTGAATWNLSSGTGITITGNQVVSSTHGNNSNYRLNLPRATKLMRYSLRYGQLPTDPQGSVGNAQLQFTFKSTQYNENSIYVGVNRNGVLSFGSVGNDTARLNPQGTLTGHPSSGELVVLANYETGVLSASINGTEVATATIPGIEPAAGTARAGFILQNRYPFIDDFKAEVYG